MQRWLMAAFNGILLYLPQIQGLGQDLSSLSFGQAVSWKPPFWTGSFLKTSFLDRQKIYKE